MRIAESELIINGDGSCFHLHLRPEELADNVILVGDIGRVDMIRDHLTDVEFERQAREFRSTTGKYNGKRVTVISTGIGTDNCDIVINEIDALANIDFNTREVKKDLKSLNILRIGTSGAIQPDIELGTYLFSGMSLGCDGLLNWYKGREEVCVPGIAEEFKKQVDWNRNLSEPYFVMADRDIAERFRDCTVSGLTVSAQGFYGPQGRVLRLGLSMDNFIDKFEKFEYDGWKITNFEMECSAIYSLGKLLGHKCGTVCLIIAQRYRHGANTDYKSKMNDLVETALDRLTR
ncbi:MAG: nucleoside phosphorylase [Bacteroidales bacterium]|nr:nucleoside phosphorylase [Candidatus Hennigimonas equi]